MAFRLTWVLINSALILLLCILIEHVSATRRYRLRDRFPGVLLFPVGLIFGVLMTPVFEFLFQLAGVRPLFDTSGWPALGAVLALVVARDFLNYWQHRFDHRFVWPIHAVHHSQTDLHAANGYAHPFQVLSEFLLISIPLTLIGVEGVAVPLGVGILLSLQAVVIHSPTRVHLGPLRRVIVDHRFHRIHHSLEERHFDKNFGIVFSIWDQLFGTAYFPHRDEYPDVGLEGFDPPRGFWDYVLHPLRHWRMVDAPQAQTSE